MTKEELQTIRSNMEEEHRKDFDALERLMRFVSANGNGSSSRLNTLASTMEAPVAESTDPNQSLLMNSPDGTTLGHVEAIIRERHTRTWTAQQLNEELSNRGHAPQAKNPTATISVSLKKLIDRGRIKLVRAGTGRQPHVYQWKQVPIQDCEVIDENPN